MRCKVCFKNINSDRPLVQNSSIPVKLNEIQSLKNLILQQKNKLNSNLAKVSPIKPKPTLSQQPSKTNPNQQKTLHQQSNNQPHQSTKTLNDTLFSISQKQNLLLKIKKLKHQINLKSTQIQSIKSTLNQNLNTNTNLKNSFFFIKNFLQESGQTKKSQLINKIKDKKQIIISLSKIIQGYFSQVVSIDFGVLYIIQKGFIEFQKENIFRIKKADELQFSNNLRPQDWMAQSIFELDNIEQISIKRKLSQKMIHILYQNLIIFTIVKKLSDIWFPYPIHCNINFFQSKLISKINDLSICGNKIIDFSRSTKLSHNIIQIFPEQLQKINSTQNKTTSQNSSQFQIDQSLDYYKRKYEINKTFANCLQVNSQFLSSKYGCQERPLMFLNHQLILKIIQKYQCQSLIYQKGTHSDCPINIYQKGYGSMFKQIQVSKLLELFENKQQSTMKSIEKIDEEGDIENKSGSSELIQKSQNNENQSSWNWPSIKQSVYEIIVPESLQNVKSNDTDNDEFQLLTF